VLETGSRYCKGNSCALQEGNRVSTVLGALCVGAGGCGWVCGWVCSPLFPIAIRYVPTDAPPNPDAPPSVGDAEGEVLTTEYDFEGYLIKKGGGKRLFGRKNWQKRYFVMIDAQLAYFKSMEACVCGFSLSCLLQSFTRVHALFVARREQRQQTMQV